MISKVLHSARHLTVSCRIVQKTEQAGELAVTEHGTEADLKIAADSAQEAWQRASSLATASAYTVLDAIRVTIIATAQR